MTIKSGATVPPKEKKPTTTKPKAEKVAETKVVATVVPPTTKAPEQQPEKPVAIVGAGLSGTVTVDPKVLVVVGSDIHGMKEPLVHVDAAGFGIHHKKDDEPVVNEVIGVTYPRVVVMNNPTSHTVTEPSSRVYAEPYRQSKPHTLNSEAEYVAMQKGVENHNARLKLETGITIIDFVGV